MVTIALWVGLACVVAFVAMALVVAVLSLSTDDIARLLDEDVRR